MAHRFPIIPIATDNQTRTCNHLCLVHIVCHDCTPTLSTLCKALNTRFLNTFPEITSVLVRNHPPAHDSHCTGKYGPTKVESPFNAANTDN